MPWKCEITENAHAHFDWHVLALPNPINFLIHWGPFHILLLLESLYQQHFVQMNFHFKSFEQLSSDFLAWNCGSALAEILLTVVEEMTFYSADMSFSPTRLLSDTQPPPHTPLCCHYKNSTKNQMSLRWLLKEVFKLSTAVTSKTSARGVSLGQMTRNTLFFRLHIEGGVYDAGLFIWDCWQVNLQ